MLVKSTHRADDALVADTGEAALEDERSTTTGLVFGGGGARACDSREIRFIISAREAEFIIRSVVLDLSRLTPPNVPIAGTPDVSESELTFS